LTTDSRTAPGEVQSRTAGEAGFQGALDRFEAAVRTQRALEEWTSLVEALAWVVALDEWHNRHLKGRGYRREARR